MEDSEHLMYESGVLWQTLAHNIEGTATPGPQDVKKVGMHHQHTASIRCMCQSHHC
jgi:hypothetical protein